MHRQIGWLHWIICWLAVVGHVTKGDHRPYDCPPTVSPYPTETAAPSPSPSELPSLSNAPTITSRPTVTASQAPTITPQPTAFPTESPAPSPSPSETPTLQPSISSSPSTVPSDWPSLVPSAAPTTAPSMDPTIAPTSSPSAIPSDTPSLQPTPVPTTSQYPSLIPSDFPSLVPSTIPSVHPTTSPSSFPSDIPSLMPSKYPSIQPTQQPSSQPSSQQPSVAPAPSPTERLIPLSSPSSGPSSNPTAEPSRKRIFAIQIPSPTLGPLTSDAVYIANPTFVPHTSKSGIQSNTPSFQPSIVPKMLLVDDTTSPAENAEVAPSNSSSLDLSTEPTGAPTLESFPTISSTTNKSQSSAPSSVTLTPTSAHPSITVLSVSPTTTTGPVTPSSSSSGLFSDEPSFMPSLASPSMKNEPPAGPTGENHTTESDRSITVTASSSVTLRAQNSTLDMQRIAIFESVSLEFLTDHYSRIVDEPAIEFASVKVVSQTPQSVSTGRQLQDDVNDEITELFDIDILLDIVGELLPGKDFVFMDFQWVVETIFDVNLKDFYNRLENTGEFKPAGIVGGTEETSQKVEDGTTTGESFSTWMVASLAAIAFSVFLTAVLVTGAVRRARIHAQDPEVSRSRDFESCSSHYENDIRSHPQSIRTGLSAGFEEESLDGLKLVQSASSLKSGVSSKRCRSFKDEYGSIVIPVEETNAILKKLSSEKEPGLNARMRKRLIEREVQSNGYEAGLSMEAILRATSSFNSEDGEYESMRPLPIDVDQGLSDHNRTKKPTTGGLFSNWFGQRDDEEFPSESRTEFTLNSAPFHSPHSNALKHQYRKSTRGLSLPSKAEVITIGESVRDEQYPISTTNWNVWDCSSAVGTPTIPDISEEEKEDNKKSPFKFISPNLKKAALRAIGLGGSEDNSVPPQSLQLSDDYDYALDQRNEQPQGNSGISHCPSNDNNNTSARKKRHLKASTPLWMSEQVDHATGFVHIAPGDSTTAGSRRSSLSSFASSPRGIQRPPRHPSMGTEAASSTSSPWRRPGKITTEFASSPLKRRLARARLDPPDRINPIHRNDHYHSNSHEHHHDQENETISAPSCSRTNLPHSSVRLVKKNSSLSKISKLRKPHKVVEYMTKGAAPSSRGRGGGRIGASPMVEMSVASNSNATILGSMDNDNGGLELEWGLTI